MGIDPHLSADSTVDGHQQLLGRFPERLPEGDFDCATLLAVVEHMDSEQLQETGLALASVLRDQGSVVVTVPSPQVDRILEVLIRLRLIDGMDADDHHQFDVKTLEPAWKACGLELRLHRRFQLGLNHLIVFEKTSTRGG